MAILTGQYASDAMRRQIGFKVVLPVEVSGRMGRRTYLDGPFPALYLLHGFSGGSGDWLYYGHAAEMAEKYRIAIVMPEGGNGFYLNNPRSDEMCADFVGRELVEVTRRLFPLSREREQTFIGGFSMGGFGALRNGLYYNDVFGAAFGLSSALITDEVAGMKPGEDNGVASYEYYAHTFGDPSSLSDSDRAPKALAKMRLDAGETLPRLFLACGTEDFLYPANLDMHNYLTSLGVVHEWITFPGVHDFRFWNAALPMALDFILNAPEA